MDRRSSNPTLDWKMPISGQERKLMTWKTDIGNSARSLRLATQKSMHLNLEWEISKRNQKSSIKTDLTIEFWINTSIHIE